MDWAGFRMLAERRHSYLDQARKIFKIARVQATEHALFGTSLAALDRWPAGDER
jgi:hypothetical protein